MVRVQGSDGCSGHIIVQQWSMREQVVNGLMRHTAVFFAPQAGHLQLAIVGHAGPGKNFSVPGDGALILQFLCFTADVQPAGPASSDASMPH